MSKDEKPDIIDALKKGMKDKGFEVLEGKEAVDFMESEMNKPENVKAREENAKECALTLAEFFNKEHKYEWTGKMGEISGMGGSYEQGCRAMVIAGLEYWDKHTELDPRFKGWEGVYGILNEDNADAKALTEAALHPVEGDCTGAMHQASISTILYIKKHGWDKYVQEMSKSK